jgi:hypothetical protein
VQRVFSFSAKPRDKLSITLVEWYQIYSIQTGISFSRLVLNALKDYKEKLTPEETGVNDAKE